MLDNVALAGQPVVARRLLADDPEVVAHVLDDLAVEGAFGDLAHRELHEHALEVHVRRLLLPLCLAPAEAFKKFALKSFGGVALGQSALRWEPSPWGAKACAVGEVTGDSFAKGFDRRTEACPTFSLLRPPRAR